MIPPDRIILNCYVSVFQRIAHDFFDPKRLSVSEQSFFVFLMIRAIAFSNEKEIRVGIAFAVIIVYALAFFAAR